MGALAVEQVAQRLEVSLDVLKGASRSAAPRQQTLRATVDWSHRLLSETERTLLRRLSVFAGGWTLETAEAEKGMARGRGTAPSASKPRPMSPGEKGQLAHWVNPQKPIDI